MRRLWGAVFILLCHCGGKLSHEQTQEAKKFIAANKIKKIPKATIMVAALNYGDSISAHVHQTIGHLDKRPLERTFSVTYGVDVHLLRSGEGEMTTIEQEILAAYEMVKPRDRHMPNVQAIGKDSILYTVPVTTIVDRDAAQTGYVLAVYIPVRQIVKNIKVDNH